MKSERGLDPLPGGLGRTLKRLFPSAPPARPGSHGRTVVVAVARAAGLGIGAGVLLIRQAGRPAWNTLWAEDGAVFLPRALSHSWSSLFHGYAGYRQLVPQLIADAVARFPLRFAAAGFAIAGALIASGCAIFVFHASAGHIHRAGLRALLACSVILLPTAVTEIANSGVDAPWYLMYALFWALLWRPRSRRGLAAGAVIAFAAMASNILNLLYLPLVAARAIALPRAREHAVTSGWLAGIAFQMPEIFRPYRWHRPAPVPAGLHFYAQHVLVAAVTGWCLAWRLQTAIGVPAAIAVAAAVIAAVVAWAWHADVRVRLFTVTALVMGLTLAIIPALLRYWPSVAASSDLRLPGDRFTTSAVLLIDAIALIGADACLHRTNIRLSRSTIRPRIAALLLIAGLSVGWSTSFRYPNVRSADPPWSQTYISFGRGTGRSSAQPVTHFFVSPRWRPYSRSGNGSGPRDNT